MDEFNTIPELEEPEFEVPEFEEPELATTTLEVQVKGFLNDNDDYVDVEMADMVAESFKRIREFKAETIAKFKPLYPDAKFSDLFFMNYRRALKEDAICETCKGVPCKKSEGSRGFRSQVVCDWKFKEMYVMAYRCPYVASNIIAQHAAKEFSRAQVPQCYVGKTFADFVVTADNENAVAWARRVVEKKTNESLYFFGESGRGKTFLASIIAQEFLKRGKSVIFGEVPYLLDQMRYSYNDNSSNKISEMMDTLSKVDLLVLDDMGTEVPTPWAIERIYLIVNSRYKDRKQNILTSNYNLDKLAEVLCAHKDCTDETRVIGKRIVSRLSELCKVSRLKGDDWRPKVRRLKSGGGK